MKSSAIRACPSRSRRRYGTAAYAGAMHRQLVQRADTVESELKTGEAGRERLLQDPDLPAG